MSALPGSTDVVTRVATLRSRRGQFVRNALLCVVA
jgi:hypothetical protein